MLCRAPQLVIFINHECRDNTQLQLFVTPHSCKLYLRGRLRGPKEKEERREVKGRRWQWEGKEHPLLARTRKKTQSYINPCRQSSCTPNNSIGFFGRLGNASSRDRRNRSTLYSYRRCLVMNGATLHSLSLISPRRRHFRQNFNQLGNRST